MNRATETVSLSDGRKVVLQELSGMDNMIAKVLIKAKSPSELIQLPEVLVCISIIEIDGQKFRRPTNMVGVQAFMGEVKAKDFGRLEKAYKRLNEEEDDSGEEVSAAE